MRLRLAFSAVVLSATAVCAQVNPLQLTITGRTQSDGIQLGVISYPVKAAANGDVYVRLIDHATPGSGPVVKISSDGKSSVRFILPRVEKSDDGNVGDLEDFAPATNGGAYILVSTQLTVGKPVEYKLYRYGGDGKLETTTTVGSSFRPLKFAVLESGDLCMTGIEEGSLSGISKLRTAMFDRKGQWIRDVVLPGDVSLPADVSSGETDAFAEHDARFAILTTMIEAADDGNIYLTRRTPSGPVFVISAQGTVLHRFLLHPPERSQLGAVKVGKGVIAAEYRQYATRDKAETVKVAKFIYQILNVATGEEKAEYWHADGEIGAAFTGYDPGQGLSFLTRQQSGAVLVTARP